MSFPLHPGLLTSLHSFYPDTCTIQVATESQDGAGWVSRSWATLSGHADIPCTVQSVGGQEAETARQVFVLGAHRIALRGSYPAITEQHRVAVTDGDTYDIERVHQDSHGKTTYLDVQVVT